MHMYAHVEQKIKEILENREVRVLLSHAPYRKAVRALKWAATLKDLARVAICGAMIDINSICNFGRCLNCIDHLSVNQPHIRPEMGWPLLRGIIEDLASMGCRFIEPMGGEPMMYSAYGRFLELTTRLGIALKIVSNGSLAHHHLPPLVAASRVPGSSIRFSVNGDETTYPVVTRLRDSREVYHRILDNIRMLAKQGVRLLVSYVVFPENSHTIYSTAKQVRECGASRFLVLPGRDPLTKRVLLPENGPLMRELSRTADLGDNGTFQVTIPQTFGDGKHVQSKSYRLCACAFLKPVIGVERNLYPCSYHKQREDLVIGKVEPGKRFREVWQSENRAQRLAEFRPNKECGNISCTRHYLNHYVDTLDGSSIRKLHEKPSVTSEEVFF